MDAKVFHLYEMTGEQFEEVVRQIFSRKGYVAKKTQITGDEGRDIIATNKTETLVIECKHQRHSIGRPVVQKLHSAALTYGATGALLVTSGTASTQAHEYAKKATDGFVVIWTHDTLAEEGRKVNIFLVGDKGNDTTSSTFYFFVPSSSATADQLLLKKLRVELQSHPYSIDDSVIYRSSDLAWQPTIWIDYSVNKIFRTQAGVIYHAKAKDTKYFAPGGIFDKESLASVAKIGLAKTPDYDLRNFDNALAKFPSTYSLEHDIRRDVSKLLTKDIHYTGANNVSYSRLCVVKESDVMTSAKYVLIRAGSIAFTTGPKTHDAVLIDCDIKILFRSKKGWKLPAILCNDCGTIESRNKVNRKIGCGLCKRTLCKDHIWKSFLLLFAHWKILSLCHKCFLNEAACNSRKLSRRASVSIVTISLLGGLLASAISFLANRSQFPVIALGAVTSGTSFGIMGLFYLFLHAKHKSRIEAAQSYSPAWRHSANINNSAYSIASEASQKAM